MAKQEQLGPYILEQPEGVFPLGGDTLALASFATLRPRWRVCDLGTGSGALLLLLAGRESTLSLNGIELDPVAAQAARDNLNRNGLTGQILHCDLRTAPLPAGSVDLAVSNPPYFALGSGISGGCARAEEDCTLDELCAAAARLVRSGGRFALCHRPERLVDLLVCLRTHGLEPKRLQLLSHSPFLPPSAVLVESVRQGKPSLTILPPLFTHES